MFSVRIVYASDHGVKRRGIEGDGEESEEREIAQAWKDRICVSVRFLLRGSATCLRALIRALNTSALPTDHASANRVSPGDVCRAMRECA